MLSVVGTALVVDDPTSAAYFLPWTQPALLLAGCGLAASRLELRERAAGVVGPLAFAGLGALLVTGDLLTRRHLAVLLVAAAVLSCALIAAVESTPRSIVARLLGWRPLALLG